MAKQTLGIILHGATGRICSTQHLHNALAPIIAEGGLPVGGDTVMPHLLLVGRNEARLAEIARANNVADWTTDLDAALADPGYPVLFEAAATHQRLATLAARRSPAGRHRLSIDARNRSWIAVSAVRPEAFARRPTPCPPAFESGSLRQGPRVRRAGTMSSAGSQRQPGW